jgi:RNA polymerase sigma-70 factor (ECF subfamily)
MLQSEGVMDRIRSDRDIAEIIPALRRKAVDPDTMLVHQLRRQEAPAVEALVATYGDRVYRLAFRITGSSSDAEEVVQDAFWSAIRHIDTFRGASAFGSWLYRITANAAYQKLRGRRSKRNEVAWEELAPSFDQNGRHVEPVVDWSSRVEDPAIQAELRSVLSSAIDELPDDYRTALVLHDMEGLSNCEIAETLNVKVSTIKSRVHRARLFLRRRWTDYLAGNPAPSCS